MLNLVYDLNITKYINKMSLIKILQINRTRNERFERVSKF